MKKAVLFSMLILLVAVLAVASASPGEARASKIAVCALQTNTGEIPGKTWFSEDGTIMHIRGGKTYGIIQPLPGHSECDPAYANGQIEMELNLNLNLVTGEGNAYGKHTITLGEGINGSWVGSYSGKIVDFAFSGLAVSHGSGDLEGMLEKMRLQQTGETTYESFGMVLVP